MTLHGFRSTAASPYSSPIGHGHRWLRESLRYSLQEAPLRITRQHAARLQSHGLFTSLQIRQLIFCTSCSLYAAALRHSHRKDKASVVRAGCISSAQVDGQGLD